VRATTGAAGPTATDEKTRKVFSVLAVISLLGTVSGKPLKLLLPGVIFKAENAPNSISAGGAYSAPPDPMDLRGPTSKGKGRKGPMGRGRKGVM